MGNTTFKVALYLGVSIAIKNERKPLNMKCCVKSKAVVGNVLVGAAVGSVVGLAVGGINRKTKINLKKLLKAKVSNLVEFVDTAEHFVKSL